MALRDVLCSEKAVKEWDATAGLGRGNGRQILGEFLYDATCPSYDVRLLLTRIKGLYWDHDRKVDDYYDEDTEADYYGCYISPVEALPGPDG